MAKIVAIEVIGDSTDIREQEFETADQAQESFDAALAYWTLRASQILSDPDGLEKFTAVFGNGDWVQVQLF
jgi:hypothetical protein